MNTTASITPAQHAARAHMLHEAAARLQGTITFRMPPHVIARKVRGYTRLQQWASDHLAAAVGQSAFHDAMHVEHTAWNDRWDRRDAARAKRSPQPRAA